ncbi:MAG: endolytic transglycosylase MltG [Eubacteriaceae bacterium]|nr:endolytic transglycosylase MltG [Eubacteriaceae bacterium]
MARKIKKKVSKGIRIVQVIAVILVVLICGGVLMYNTSMSPVDQNDTEIRPFTVGEGDTYKTLASRLKAEGFIRSETAYNLYLKSNAPDTPLYTGKYPLSPSMDLRQIVETIASGEVYYPDAFFLTFPEGKNMRYIATLIAENTDNTEEDVYALLSDADYLQRILDEYWFLPDEITDPRIYYSLEGYLFPDTYQLTGPDMSVEEIFEMMLERTGEVLEPYREDIRNSQYTLHQIMTMASIVELEAGNANDRAGVSGVFYNRLRDGWALGSDVTTYYAIKVEVYERDLYMYEIEDVNAYNTRPDAMAGQFPVGPICNPGAESIYAALFPSYHDYYYFVSDKYGNTYFAEDYDYFEEIIYNLQEQGLWYEYE